MTTDTILQDQKKHTLDALERRFALAEAELRLQKQKNKRRPHEENKRVTHNVNSSSADVTNAFLTPSSMPLPKKYLMFLFWCICREFCLHRSYCNTRCGSK